MNSTPKGQQTDDFLGELEWRGVLHQCSDIEGLRKHLESGSRRAYVGLDPTADSLTIGNLATLKLLAHFQRAGHEPVIVAGGGTGMIGDPGGKSAERPLLSIEDVRSNVRSQMRIYDALLPGAMVVNNADWLLGLGYVDVLRDVGKHFSVNEMVKRDSVRNRLEGDGISYTEFSYMILQAYDFAHLFEHHDVTLQMGGSDQWGNIVSGADLIRRLHGGTAYALTGTLVVKADGSKFGKSESGAIWLTSDRTSPYAFHQFWLNADDSDVVSFLKRFTFLDRDAIRDLEQSVAAEPGSRRAQRVLADEVTTWLHGPDATARAKSAAQALFTGDVRGLDSQTLYEVVSDIACKTLSRASLGTRDMVSILVEASIAKSNREARDFLSSNSISVNGERVGADRLLTVDDLLHDSVMLVRRGKKHWSAIRWE